ncbi:MAG: hypothetical protein QW290_09130 [Sulfolobales archaeon]
MSSVIWLRRYPVDTLQVYFAASLELQGELISHGFYVPKSPDGRVVMPVPLIYSNFRGWLKPAEPITIERLIPPEWLGLTSQQLGWVKTVREGKEAYTLPQEEVYVNLGVEGDSVVLDLDVRGYHLERTSIRGVNPDKWTNWAMLYVSAEYLDELVAALRGFLPSYYGSLVPGGTPEPRREVQQGGKEVTYYVEVPVEEFSLCLGCFDLVQRYLYVKAGEHCVIDPNSTLCRNPRSVISGLKLRLSRSHAVRTFAKVGVAKISGKRPQVMVKLASDEPRITIRGVLKDRVEGKARGELVYCNHEVRRQYLVLNLVSFYKALIATSKCLSMLPREV